MTELFSWFLYLACLLNSFPCTVKCGMRKNPLFNGLNSRGVNNYEVVVPQRVDEEGKFISHVIPHRYNTGSAKESDAIFYRLPIAGEGVVIQLTPNLKLISPGAVVEIHGKASESYTADDKMGRMFGNRKINRLKNRACYYTGIVQGFISSKVALSTCSGLAGFIHTVNGTYTIEPSGEYEVSPGDEHPHVLYGNDGDSDKWTGCKFHDSQRSRSVREAKDNGNGGNASVTPYPLYIETLIVTDKSLLAHNQDFDLENYILTVFNMAFSLFHDASLGLLIKLSLVRIIRLEIEEEGMNMNANQDAIKTLQSFQEWQYRINPGDDTHPNHHDIAILITRLDMYSNLSYGFLGVSTLGSVCDKKHSAILCKDNGLRLGFVIAHEIAHLLGAEHDGFNNSCDGTDDDGFRTVMHPQVLLTTETWSKCTQGYFRVLLESGFGNCLYDEPSEHNFNVQDLLPGTIYDADFQCRQLMTPTARECNEGSTCDSLNCRIPGHLCVVTKVPPAAGTRCGENMWCRQKKCLMVGERPDAVDGNWGDWSAWSECSRTCGSGVSFSERLCNRPMPSHGGRYCLGKSKRHRICSSKPCDMSQPSFRDLQCGEFDDWIYPEDGRKHTWKEYFYHEGNPCILFCINENLEVVALKPRVIDGTSCYKGMRDVCVDGMCVSVPCDLKLESNAIEDVCGVCHGDGTTCDFSQGQQSMEKFPKAVTKLITVPAGTRNIKVEEVMPSAARILVRDKETKDFYVRGIKLGMYHVPGSQAWLGMLKSRQEALTIPGPVTKALTIWIERVENVTVKWSMALPTTQQRKPEFTWDFVRWSPCSAICGPGTQKSEPSCIEEKAGLVESSYCADLEVPTAKIRFCEMAKCEPRWMVADWKDCENVSSSKVVKKRIVRCVKTVGEGEGESDVIPDAECPPPKPEEEEPCDTRHKRSSAFKRKSSPGLIGYSGDQVMFSSNRIKFGSHKKYDEYLKNFNAIATPQRKSEMIPLHILDTPHFRHYYRILQSENSSTDSKTRLDLDRALSHAKEDAKTKTNSLLSQIYKNTFSGNQQSYNGRDNVMDSSGDETWSLIGARRKKLTPPLRSYSSVNSKRRKQRRRRTFFLPHRYQGENYRKRKNKKFGTLKCRSNIECVILRRGRIRKLLRKRKVSHMKQRRRKYPYWKIHSMNSDKAGYSNQESETVNIFEKPGENYTIRFGQVLLDQDEDADLEIVFEKGDKDDLMGLEGFRSSDRDKVWKLRGDEAIQFMKNITGIDWNNKTTSDAILLLTEFTSMRGMNLDKVCELQKRKDSIRNICILAHVDHGKTTLADSLVASNGIISSKMAGKLRYMDNRKDEQERGITMKSSAITLLYSSNCSDYLINLIDSPGHVDFSSEVSTAVRLCDGAIVVIDVVEGVCPQTKVALHQAWLESIKPILVLNKIDRYITELKLSPMDAYFKLVQVLEQVNAVMGELFAADVLAKSNLEVEGDKNHGKCNTYDWSSGLEKADDEHLYFSPERGNVIFASAYDGWGFEIRNFAKLYSEKLGVKEEILNKTLWGDYYLNAKTSKILRGAQEKAKKPLFVRFVLENLWEVYEVAARKDRDKLEKIINSLGIKLTARDLRHADYKVQLQAVCSQWLPIAETVLGMICRKLPPPNELDSDKAERLMCSQGRSFDTLPDETKNLKSAFLNCSSEPGAPTIVFVSKMFPVEKANLPVNKPKPLTNEELAERREIARRRHKARMLNQEIIENTNVPLSEEEQEVQGDPEEEHVFIAFARIFSGTLREGQELFVLGPKHDPERALKKLSPNDIVLGRTLKDLRSCEHVTKVKIKNLYLLMGRDLQSLKEAPAGNVVGIGDLEEHILKSGTLSDTLACPSFSELKKIVVPILRVAVEPTHPSDMPQVIRGLRLLNQADAAVQVLVQETGEHVIVTDGEVHLQRCIDDLRERYAKVPINCSEPIVPFRETIVLPPKVDMVNEAIDSQSLSQMKGLNEDRVTVTTPNKQCTVTLRAAPLPPGVVSILEKNSSLIRIIDRNLSNRSAGDEFSKLSLDQGGEGEELEQELCERTVMTENISGKIEILKRDLKKAFADAEKHWDNMVDKIWCFGPKRCGSNILFNCIEGYERNFWKFDGEGEDSNIYLGYDSIFCNGFQMATLAGPLCEEPMMGIGFFVESWIIEEEKQSTGIAYGPLSGQIMSCVKEGCRKAFQAQPQRLMAAMYSCSIQVNAEALGKMYAVLGRRHGRVLHGDMNQGSASFFVTAVLPVVESFAFASEIRKQTSGLAVPQLVFSHWEVIDIDPFWYPRTEEEYLHYGEKADSENRARKYMNAVRRRKGLYVEEKIVEFAEKQRTLSKNK